MTSFFCLCLVHDRMKKTQLGLQVILNMFRTLPYMAQPLNSKKVSVDYRSGIVRDCVNRISCIIEFVGRRSFQLSQLVISVAVLYTCPS